MRRGARQRRIALNFFPANLSKSSARLWVARWRDSEHQESLQVEGVQTWRDRDDGSRLYIWHPEPSAAWFPPEGEPVVVELDENPLLIEHLLRDAVRRRLVELGFTPVGRFGSFVNFNKGSLIASIPTLSDVGDEVGIYPRLKVDVFFTKNSAGQLLFGLVVDVMYSTKIDMTIAEWAAAGLDRELSGTYVTLRAGGAAAERFPHLVGQVIGRIAFLRGDGCVLTDLKEAALADLPASDIAPEPTRVNLEAYLGARFEEAFRSGQRKLTAELRRLVRPKERLRLARALVLKRIAAEGDLELLRGLTVSLDDVQILDERAVQQLEDPEYSFDRSGRKFARRIDTGLKRYGPYDQRLIGDRPFRILVVGSARGRGEIEIGMRKLLSGTPTQQNVFTGLRTMYRLGALDVDYAFADVDPLRPMAGYSRAANQAIQDALVMRRTYDLVVAVIRHDYRKLPDAENPYFQVKALALVQLGVPTQSITIEKLRLGDEDLQYVLNTMALACYAKLGGTSHVLKIPDEREQSFTELVFGIGRSVQREGRFGEAEETVGFATVFRANGEYLYNDCTPYCDASEYARALEGTILRAVGRVAAFEQLEDGARLRLIFHVPRRSGRREAAAVRNAVAKIPRYDVEYALVHVNDDHHLHAFDLANGAGQGLSKRKPEAAFLPPRGLVIELGPRERLVTFVGVDQYRGYGAPNPLRISVDRASTFTDVNYIARQIYMLAFMDAGTLNPSVLPVSISYPAKLARITGHLRGVQQWTVDQIQAKLGAKLWFI